MDINSNVPLNHQYHCDAIDIEKNAGFVDEQLEGGEIDDNLP